MKLSILLLTGCLCAALSRPTPTDNVSIANSAQILFESQNGTFFENVAVRSNGHLLITSFSQGSLYSFDPYTPGSVPEVVARVPDATGLFGIGEIAPDVFVVAGGVLNMTDISFLNGSAKWATIDFSHGCKGQNPVVKVVARASDLPVLNGLCPLPFSPHIILTAESKQGRIIRTDTLQGTVDVVFQDDRFAADFSAPIALGLNGLKIFDNYLYVSLGTHKIFGRVPIGSQGNCLGEYEDIAHLPSSWGSGLDDFAISKEGDTFMAVQPNGLIKISPDGEQSLILSLNSTVVPISSTATALSNDERTLFLVTGGPFTGNGGGQIISMQR